MVVSENSTQSEHAESNEVSLLYVFNTLPGASGTVQIQSLSPYDRPQIDHSWQNLSIYDQNNLQYRVNYIRNLTKNTRWDQRYIKQELCPGNHYGDLMIYIDD